MIISDWILLIENFLWVFIGIPVLFFLATVLTFQSKFAQIRNLPLATKTFLFIFKKSDPNSTGIPPIKAFFASIGGSVGVGNVVGVCVAVQIGGPGALFWIWVIAFAGAIMKYAEVYLGIRYRTINAKGEYCGGTDKMLTIPGNARLFISHHSVNMRKSFEGLSVLKEKSPI